MTLRQIRRFWRAFRYALARTAQDRKKQIAWHRHSLMHLDPGFWAQQVQLELVRRRNDLRRQGIGPLDPRYPDFEQVAQEIGYPVHTLKPLK